MVAGPSDQVHLYDEPPGGFKKRRTRGACDLCDSAKMPGNICSNCRAFNSECTHKISNKKKTTFINMTTPSEEVTSQNGGTIDTHTDSDRNHDFAKRQISAILDTPSYQVPVTDQSLLHRTLTEISVYARTLEKTLSDAGLLASNDSPAIFSNSSPSSHSSPSSNPDVSSTSLHPTDPTSVYSVYGGHGITEDDMTNTESDPAAVEVNLADGIEHLELKQSDDSFFGKSSQLSLMKTALKVKSEYDGDTSRPADATNIYMGNYSDSMLPSSTQETHFGGKKRSSFWNVYPWQRPILPPQPSLIFPPPVLLSSLVDLYFAHRNTFMPLLHRPTFLQDLASRLHERERAFGELVLSVCALGARFSSDERVFADGAPANSEEQFHSAGWKYINQIGSLQEASEYALYKVQTICNVIVFLSSTSSPAPIWSLLSIGVRHAQAVGAHRRAFLGPKPSIKQELWKRAYWILVNLDSFTSAFLGRPKATDPAEYDLDLPLECDDEFWEHPDPEQAFKQPLGRPSMMEYWRAHLKLIDILAFAQKNIYAVKKPHEIWGSSNLHVPSWDAKVVAELDAALNQWVDNIPDYLRWDPHREDLVFFEQSCSLYCTYYFVQIHVHRPFIRPELPRTDGSRHYSGMSYSSLGVCANAARSCLHVLDLHSRRTDFYSPQPSPGSSSSTPTTSTSRSVPSQMVNSPVVLFNSIIMILLNLWSGKRLGLATDFKREMEDVHLSLRILKSYERKYQNAGRMFDIIHELISAMAPTNVGSNAHSRKRYRDRDGEQNTNRDRIHNPTTRPFNVTETVGNQIDHTMIPFNFDDILLLEYPSSSLRPIQNSQNEYSTPESSVSVSSLPTTHPGQTSYSSQSDSSPYSEASALHAMSHTQPLQNLGEILPTMLDLPLHTEDLGRLPIHLGGERHWNQDVHGYCDPMSEASLDLTAEHGENPMHGLAFTDALSRSQGNVTPDSNAFSAVSLGSWEPGEFSIFDGHATHRSEVEPFHENVVPERFGHLQGQNFPAENAFTNLFNATPTRDGWFDWGTYLSNVDDLLRTVESD
ncbi:fungal-specific transcription factor domain-containing protein [Lentinula raphanica]|uniref:Fungal-specific transcription factor domain-containing protein n=1 Tax=Lentinula raphanica TaxID=153919 RepID=A0AA38P480_9AGAR|nr:fungal-specific transcription factor domain-containing protein [Lentinula raphanica]